MPIKKAPPPPMNRNAIRAKAAETLRLMKNRIGNPAEINAAANRINAKRAANKAHAEAVAARKEARASKPSKSRAPSKSRKAKDPAIVKAAQNALASVGLSVKKTAKQLSPNAIKRIAKKTLKNLGLR